MQDRRLVNRMQVYWNQIRKDKPMPEIEHLNPAAIDDMWRQCIKFEVAKTQGGTSFTYRFMGEELVRMFGRDLTGTVLDKRITGYPYNMIVKKLDGIMQSKDFVIEENHFVNENSKVVKYRACFMPFGNDAKGITHVVVGYSVREF